MALHRSDDNIVAPPAKLPYDDAAYPISDTQDPRNPQNKYNPMLWALMNQMNTQLPATSTGDLSPVAFRDLAFSALESLVNNGLISNENKEIFATALQRLMGSTESASEFQRDFTSFRDGGLLSNGNRTNGTSVSLNEMEAIAKRSPADRDGDYRVIAVQTGVGKGGRAHGTMAIVDSQGHVLINAQGQPALFDFVSGIRGSGRGGAMPGFNGGDFFGSGNDGINAVWRLDSPVYNHGNPRIDGFFMHVTGYESRTGRGEIGIHQKVGSGNGDIYAGGGSMGCPVMNESDTKAFANFIKNAGSHRPDMIIVADRGGYNFNLS